MFMLIFQVLVLAQRENGHRISLPSLARVRPVGTNSITVACVIPDHVLCVYKILSKSV